MENNHLEATVKDPLTGMSHVLVEVSTSRISRLDDELKWIQLLESSRLLAKLEDKLEILKFFVLIVKMVTFL